MSFLINVLIEGLLYSLLAIAVLLTYKILNFSDLSVDGTIPLGGVIAAVVITNTNNPILGIVLGFVGGFIAGSITGLLHVKIGITPLLSGIMVMTGLYSVNLFIASSNLTVYNNTTIFSSGWLTDSITNLATRKLVISLYQLAIVFIIVVVIKLILDWFLKTKYGYLIRIAGDNPQLVLSLGVNIDNVKVFTLALSNGIAALFGSVIIQYLGYYDIRLGTGMIAAGLASVILGTTILKKASGIKMTSMVIVGAILYRLSIALSYRLNAPTSFEKIVTVLIFLVAIILNGQSLVVKRSKHDKAR